MISEIRLMGKVVLSDRDGTERSRDRHEDTIRTAPAPASTGWQLPACYAVRKA
jgi:hypothetical protein